MTDKQVKFYRDIVPVIVKIANKNGYIYPSAIIAQAICESAWGGSSLAYKYNNYFGMKCGSSWKGKSVNMTTKEEYTAGTLTTIKDNFRAYDTLEEGIQGYFDFIQKTRYLNLKNATSPEDYIQKLKADGWATSSSYVTTLTNILNTNNLKSYDGTVITKSDKEIRQAVKSLQQALNDYGNYGLAVDGIIGPKTTEAYNKYRGK